MFQTSPHARMHAQFDMRIYVVATCMDPLRLYVYTEGLARFATQPYSQDKADLRWVRRGTREEGGGGWGWGRGRGVSGGGLRHPALLPGQRGLQVGVWLVRCRWGEMARGNQERGNCHRETDCRPSVVMGAEDVWTQCGGCFCAPTLVMPSHQASRPSCPALLIVPLPPLPSASQQAVCAPDPPPYSAAPPLFPSPL